MNPDVSSLVAIAHGYEKGRERIAALRVKEIRESDFRVDKKLFDGLFESALKLGNPRETYALSKALRVYFGVDR